MIYNVPTSKYTYHFEKSMFETIWKIMIGLSIFFIFFSIKKTIYNSPNAYLFYIASVYSILSLFLLKYSGKYVYSVVSGVVICSVLIQLSIFYNPHHFVLPDIMWIILVSIFAFYGLGTFYGVLTLLVNMSGAVYKYIYLSNNRDTIIEAYEIDNAIISVSIAIIVIIYLLHKIIEATVIANKDFQNANTELTNKNEIINKQHQEKTILLKEIHHRVKNNLQVISSMIKLQSIETNDLPAKKMFDATISRVVAMALIHEKMYQKDNLSKINLEDYLKSLSNDIYRTYYIDTDIKFNISSDVEVIGNRTIVPLALIFNELISNSIKYAFQSKTEGIITITVNKIINNQFKVTYSDNGTWVNTDKKSTFGLELIQTFVEQLDGEINKEVNEHGTTYILYLNNID
jgi:two-component sensor histidine kinase